jgi:hypothetical protein
MTSVDAWFTAALLAVALNASAAEPVPAAPSDTALDADFLEYLATFEGKDEDWTWFADDATHPAAKPPAGKESQTDQTKKESGN